MKTNQMMNVKIGNGNIIIGHKTQMGKLNDILAIGNSYRIKKGLRVIKLDEWLTKDNTWEFIIKVSNEEDKKSKLDIPVLGIATIIRKFPRDLKNRIAYGDILKSKKFSLVIKSQRGGKPDNRGVWANLYILLDLATYLDVDLKYEMYKIFITQNILSLRDLGGDNYIELNNAIDTFPDIKGKNNSGFYIQIAQEFRKKLEILETKGYNQEEHNFFIQKSRARWLDNLISMIEMEFITSVEELKVAIYKLK